MERQHDGDYLTYWAGDSWWGRLGRVQMVICEGEHPLLVRRLMKVMMEIILHAVLVVMTWWRYLSCCTCSNDMTEITFHVVLGVTTWRRSSFMLGWRFMMKMRLLSSWWFVNTFPVDEVTFEGDYLSCWAGDSWWGRWYVCRTFWSWHGKCLRSHPRDLCAATALLLTCSHPKALQSKTLFIFEATFIISFSKPIKCMYSKLEKQNTLLTDTCSLHAYVRCKHLTNPLLRYVTWHSLRKFARPYYKPYSKERFPVEELFFKSKSANVSVTLCIPQIEWSSCVQLVNY